VVDGPAGARTAKQISGQHGEDRALDYLQRQGLALVARNFRCRRGEIDLIMQDGDALVFIEVRKRTPGRHGDAAASITPHKQARLLAAAEFYLQRFRLPPACRFDVVAIDGAALDWIRNAISA
jgi:putative endonuclease